MQNEAEVQEKRANGHANGSPNVQESAPVKAAAAAAVEAVETVAETPGLMRLLFCVMGIYAVL